AQGAERARGVQRRRNGADVRGAHRRHGEILAFHEEESTEAQAGEHRGTVTCAGRSSIRTSTSATGSGAPSRRRSTTSEDVSSFVIRLSSSPSCEEVHEPEPLNGSSRRSSASPASRGSRPHETGG